MYMPVGPGVTIYILVLLNSFRANNKRLSSVFGKACIYYIVRIYLQVHMALQPIRLTPTKFTVKLATQYQHGAYVTTKTQENGEERERERRFV
jgi:hypothetical protein